MQDLDEARAALGYEKIKLYGISYGAKAVQDYPRMFPEHVRGMVIDHGNALDLPLFPTLPRATQSALDQVFTYCDQDEACHIAYPNIREDSDAVISRLSKGPVITSYTQPNGTEFARLTKTDLEYGLYQLLYEGNYGEIPYIIHTLASNEDWTEFVRNYLAQHPSQSDDVEPFLFMKAVIDCFEPAEAFDQGSVSGPAADTFYNDVFIESTQY